MHASISANVLESSFNGSPVLETCANPAASHSGELHAATTRTEKVILSGSVLGNPPFNILRQGGVTKGPYPVGSTMTSIMCSRFLSNSNWINFISTSMPAFISKSIERGCRWSCHQDSDLLQRCPEFEERSSASHSHRHLTHFVC